MTRSSYTSFQRTTSEMEVERAVAELRYGRPVVLRDHQSKLAAIALDCVTPSLFDEFAIASDGQHELLLTATRASRIGIGDKEDVVIPLSGKSFETVSRLAYGLGAEKPTAWKPADTLASQSKQLAYTALVLPAMVVADVTATGDRFAACYHIAASRLKDADIARQRFETLVHTSVPLKDVGDAEFTVFRGGLAQRDQVAIIVGKPDLSGVVPVRIHSSCLTGDLCGSLKCDCGDQLRRGLAMLKEAGGGVLLYLDQEGRGTGIGTKMRAYGYQHLGLDTVDADAELGLLEDHRRYEAALAMLRLLNISRVALYTNNPSKITALQLGGIAVESRTAVMGKITAENQNYLRTKAIRSGHLMEAETLSLAEQESPGTGVAKNDR